MQYKECPTVTQAFATATGRVHVRPLVPHPSPAVSASHVKLISYRSQVVAGLNYIAHVSTVAVLLVHVVRVTSPQSYSPLRL